MSNDLPILYKVIGGSRMYGLANETSDIDYRGIYEETIWQLLGRRTSEVIVTEGNLDVQIWPIAQFFKLCEKFNSNVVEILWAPEKCIVVDSWQAKMLRENKKLFLSQSSFQPIIGFSVAECRKAMVTDENVGQLSGQRLESYKKYGFCVKNAAHSLRLLDMGMDIIKERNIIFPVKNRDFLLNLKNGEVKKEEFYNLWEQKLTKLQDTIPSSGLPEELPRKLIDAMFLDCVGPKFKEYLC